jgi:hypothetical protein
LGLGDILQLLLGAGVVRELLVEFDDRSDVLGCGGRQTARHALPMLLHEDIGHDGLQDDDRGDDDQKRTRIQTLGHAVAEGRQKAPGPKQNIAPAWQEAGARQSVKSQTAQMPSPHYMSTIRR